MAFIFWRNYSLLLRFPNLYFGSCLFFHFLLAYLTDLIIVLFKKIEAVLEKIEKKYWKYNENDIKI
jgi:hypothetical protein